MANEYQEALLAAMEVVAGNTIDHLATDKTVTATIVASTNALTGEYRVSYNGGEMYAYANEGASYSENSTVYVLVPEGDFTKKKIIVGRATYTGDDENISFISSALSNYNMIGTNTILDNDGILPVGLFSYLATDQKYLYKYGDEENSLLQIDTESLSTYIEEAEAILLEIDVQTRLPKEHRMNTKGNYGIEVVIASKDRNTTDIKYDKNLQVAPQINDVLVDFKEQLLSIWSNITLTIEECRKQTGVVLDELKKYRDETEGLNDRSTIALNFILNSEIRNLGPLQDPSGDTLTKGYGYEVVDLYFVQNYKEMAVAILSNPSLTYLQKQLQVQTIIDALREIAADAENNSTEEIKQAAINFEYVLSIAIQETHAEEAIEYINNQVTAVKLDTYVLDCSSMTGNPYAYLNKVNQYNIYPIDAANFLYIDSIRIFSEGFESEDNPKYLIYGEDIFIDNIEFYGLKTITSVNGDYSLGLSFPSGQIFKISDLDDDSLQVWGRLKYQMQDISDSATYYWFKEDARITSASEDWQAFGGAGWKWLKDKGNKWSFESIKRENTAYRTKYLCVCVYKEQLILKSEFYLQNDAQQRDITIESDMGYEFNFDIGIPTLTCYVNGRNKDFEKDVIPNGRPDDCFMFIWSKIDNNIVTAYTETYEELRDKYNELLEKYNSQDENTPEDERVSFTELSAAESAANAMKDIHFDKNVITLPMNKVSNVVTFKCSVYVKDDVDSDDFYDIGSAEIVLQNANAVVPSDYYIIITHGDQVFQYSESGVTPASERYADPLEVMPLQCHFYSPSGIEINQTAYTLKWKVPLENTLIITPTEGMIQNPANGLYEWYQLREYPLQIADSYDYQALNNQVTALITYEGREFSQDSNLLFVKVGDNGTNGTDVVCKIEPIEPPKDCLPAIEMNVTVKVTADGVSSLAPYTDAEGNITSRPLWNNGKELTEDAFEFKVYNRNELLSPDVLKGIKWSIAGCQTKSNDDGTVRNLTSKNMQVITGSESDTCVVSYGLPLNENGKMSTQVIRCTTYTELVNSDGTQEGESSEDTQDQTVRQDYYAFYPIPVILYRTGLYSVKLDKTKTLKYVTYNSDGRNPLYNKNQGIFFTLVGTDGEPLSDDEISKRTVQYEVQGGIDDNAATASIKLRRTKNGYFDVFDPDTGLATEQVKDQDPTTLIRENLKDFPQIYVIPDEIYSGAYSNNNVIVSIYKEGKSGLDFEVRFIVPIQMSLNSFGLASLNAWDGNHIEINEDGNYILAPQIGAGVKNEDNTFTGVVMGKAQTYDQDKPLIGILGYNQGDQSIWLDSETGNAIFGLPEDIAHANNRYTEGRIELIPGGVSKIGMWNVGSRALWNIPIPDPNEDYWYDASEGPEYYKIIEGKYEDVGSNAGDSSNYVPEDAQIKIPEKAQGILLNANPSYVSFKGRPLTIQDDITFSNYSDAPSNKTSGKSILYPNDSLELQIDPNQGSLFSIFQHTIRKNVQSEREEGMDPGTENDWVRVLRVGIDAYGRFFTNALKDASVGIAPGFVSAFGKNVEDQYYYGLVVETGDDVRNSQTLIKMFTDVEHEEIVHISSSTDRGGEAGNSEYNRPLHLHGKDITLYANSSGFSETTYDYIKVAKNLIDITTHSSGHDYFRIDKGAGSYKICGSQDTDISGSCDVNIGDYYKIISEDFTVSSSGNINISTTNGSGTLSVTGDLLLSSSNGSSSLMANDDLTLTGTTGSVTITAGNLLSGTGHNISLIAEESFAASGPTSANIQSSGVQVNLSGGEDTNQLLMKTPGSSILISDSTLIANSMDGDTTPGISFAGNTKFQNTVAFDGGVRFDSVAKHYANMSMSGGSNLYVDSGGKIYADVIMPSADGNNNQGGWKVVDIGWVDDGTGSGSVCCRSYDFYIEQDSKWVSTWIKEVQSDLQTQINNLSSRVSSLEGSSYVDWNTYNSHAHTFTYSKNSDGYVTSISMNGDSLYTITSTP